MVNRKIFEFKYVRWEVKENIINIIIDKIEFSFVPTTRIKVIRNKSYEKFSGII